MKRMWPMVRSDFLGACKLSLVSGPVAAAALLVGNQLSPTTSIAELSALIGVPLVVVYVYIRVLAKFCPGDCDSCPNREQCENAPAIKPAAVILALAFLLGLALMAVALPTAVIYQGLGLLRPAQVVLDLVQTLLIVEGLGCLLLLLWPVFHDYTREMAITCANALIGLCRFQVPNCKPPFARA